MATISVLDRSTEADLQCAPRMSMSRDSQEWVLRRMQQTDVMAVKQLFSKLHAFNAALDPRFALSEDWDAHFHGAVQQALRGDGSLCLIARETSTDLPCGFTLAAVHRDSGIWRYHEWVEV